ncbi:MAG TPA: M56 family metallopeptidase, partial [Gemmatimonadaceae bacterium]|nr:M56 family metallopeptidase [Gemmatimonadaceae bacterium]
MTTAVIQTALAVIEKLDLAIVARATVVLAVGLTALLFARRARASVRHLLMASTFVTVLLLPMVMRTLPALTIRLSVPGGETLARPISNPGSDAVVSANQVGMRNATSSGTRWLPSFATLFRSVWAAGATLLLILLVIDLQRLRALRRSGLPWPRKNDLLRSLAVASDARTPAELLLHEGIPAPLTCGLWRPVILLPIDASDWPEADLRRALVHELEHVRRGDWATQLIARVVCACYWFHPLVWMAWRRLRLEAERACDDAVVECAESTQYAEQLVNLARRLSTAPTLPTLAMANRSDLSARVVALLDGTRRRGRVGYAATSVVVVGAGMFGLLIASVRAGTAQAAAAVATHTAPPVNVAAREMDQPELPAPEVVQRQVTRLNVRTSIRQSTSRPEGERTAPSPVADTRWLATVRAEGVSEDFVRGLIDAGYTNLTRIDVLNLFHRGITPDFIASLRRVGLTRLTIGELLAAQDMGITESFVQGFRDLGYTDLSFGDLLALRAQG